MYGQNMRACMHALCCAHSRSSLNDGYQIAARLGNNSCQELFPSPHPGLWRHQHRSHRTVVVRSSRTAAHSVLQTHVCINCVSTRAHPCSGSVVLTTNGADSVCVRSAAACGRGSSSDWPLTGLRPRPTRSRRTRRPPPGTQHARPSSHRARRQLDVRPRPCAGPARPARGPCKEARTTQRTRSLCRGACWVVASSGRAA